ncbi:YwqG family protein [Microbacteriaceae bacterium 4G12]
MTLQNRLELPPVLQPYGEMLEKTVRPYIEIVAKKGTTSLFQSKFGGYPYLPQTAEHPKDENGKSMMLLAQVNFEELPKLDDMPTKGILQFFISYGDDVYGMDFDDQTDQKNFRVIYYPGIVADETLLVTDFAYMDEIDKDMLPFTEEYELLSQLKYEAISMNDYRFEKLTTGVIDLEEEVEVNGETMEMWDVCGEHLSGTGHKIGGYPFFTQTDPRERENNYSNYDILLLQIDTDDGENEIMWGDSGVANFFIKKEDLLNLNFANVLYNWDCY